MENKCLLCGAIIPEGRQVCPTCKKGGKHEISKKLTDEQIELETYLNSFEEGDNITVTCDLLNAMEQALDLIHRLQEHNGNEVRMRCDMQRKFDDLQNLCIEQKDEIEELKEMCSKSSYKDSWKNKFFKAQEEIERLKDEKEEIKLFNLAIQNGEVDMRIESEMAKSFYGSIVQVFEQNGSKNFFTTTIDIEGKKGRYAFTIEKVGGQTVAEKLAEQKAEIERLTEELKYYRGELL